MTNLDEIMNDHEADAYERAVIAHVILPGDHRVDLTTREDGSRVWVDLACRRVTPVGFPAYVPFIDEAVRAWHEGTLNPSEFDGYAAQLRAVAAKLKLAQAHVQALRRRRTAPAVLRAARNTVKGLKAHRAKLVHASTLHTDMTPAQIGAAAGVSRRTVYVILAGDPDA